MKGKSGFLLLVMSLFVIAIGNVHAVEPSKFNVCKVTISMV
jgi:hypothetical protein